MVVNVLKKELLDSADRFLCNGDEDAFHSLIEAGESSMNSLVERLTSDTMEVVVDVLREIHTKRGRNFLENRLRSVTIDSEWKSFAEALAYQSDLGEEFF